LGQRGKKFPRRRKKKPLSERGGRSPDRKKRQNVRGHRVIGKKKRMQAFPPGGKKIMQGKKEIDIREGAPGVLLEEKEYQ